METIYSRLRAWRWNLAKELGVPSYFILSNAHLAQVALAAPLTMDELAACPGVGPKKLAQFGGALLNEVTACLSEGLEPGVIAPQAPPEAEPLSESDVAEIMTGLRIELARQVSKRLKGRYSRAQVEAVLARLSITA